MDYEKCYREALERANIIYNDKYKPEIAAFAKKSLETIFPELEKDKDERIRQSIIADIKSRLNNCTHTLDDYYREQIDWLENQDKKTPQTPQWMIKFLDENRVKFASLMDDYADQREVEGKLLAIIDWLEKQDN